jgi:hypothetical protein
MIRLIALVARRSPARNLAATLLMAAIVTIALIFAWMAPSIAASRLAVWRSLPASLLLETQVASSDATCTNLYTFTTLQGRAALANPVGLSGGTLLAMLDLEPHRTGSVAVLDALAAIDAGVGDGDVVTVTLKSASVSGPVEVRPAPIWLSDASSGGVAALTRDLPTVQAALTAYGQADSAICSGEGTTTAGAVLAEHERATASEGIGTVAAVFAGLGAMAWLAVVLLLIGATTRHRRAQAALCQIYGTEVHLARLASMTDILAAGIVAALLGAFVAQTLRTSVLRMWTDPALVGPAIIGLLALETGAALIALLAIDRRNR